MFNRVSLLARHLNRPLPNYAHRSAASASRIIGMTPQQKSLIHTAGAIIIGDEVLGGKTVDTNSAHFAKFCFSLGINLKRVEVIPDDEEDIVETVRRMSRNYDLVITTGGIGPTHDDITYSSIAKAFDLPLVLHDASYDRMKRLSRPHKSQPNFSWDVDSPALRAKKRMVEIPYDKARPDEEQVLFVSEDLWVPLCVVNGNVHIFPGIPRLFTAMLDGLKSSLIPRLTDPEGKGVYRITISTPLAESEAAGFLTDLAKEVEPKGVKVGSYPRWGKSHNVVTLVGRDREYMDSLVAKVEEAVKGNRVVNEDEMDNAGSDKDT